jgi:hypothetical protein
MLDLSPWTKAGGWSLQLWPYLFWFGVVFGANFLLRWTWNAATGVSQEASVQIVTWLAFTLVVSLSFWLVVRLRHKPRQRD